MTIDRRWAGAAAAGAALLVLLASSAARADQFVALDETWVHTPEMPDSHYRVPPAAGTPADWVSPTDYSKGTAHVYLEVHSKPTEQPTRFQVCFEATPTYACTDQSPTYTATGVYEWATSFTDFYSPPGESVDWKQGVNKVACILKDTMNNKPSADNVGAETAALYTPTEVRLVVTIVAPGSTYMPPIPTGQGGTGGTGGTGGAAGTAGTGGAPGSGATGGAGMDSSGSGAASNGTGGAPDGGSSGTGGSSPGLTENKGGCTCTMAPRSNDPALVWSALAGAVAAGARLRRRRSR